MAHQHLHLDLARGIAHRNPHQEPVQLALRQGIRALELDRVLRGDDHEGPGQRVRLAVDRHLPLAHRLQQRALRPRRGAIDLVGQHDVGEDRPAAEHELARLGVVEAAAGDVARQEIGRELDPAELAGEAAGHRLAHQRLAHPRHVLQQDVLAGQQGHQRPPHHVVLAEHHAADVLAKLSDQFADVHRGVRESFISTGSSGCPSEECAADLLDHAGLVPGRGKGSQCRRFLFATRRKREPKSPDTRWRDRTSRSGRYQPTCSKDAVPRCVEFSCTCRLAREPRSRLTATANAPGRMAVETRHGMLPSGRWRTPRTAHRPANIEI